uniref:hypothetical protein n=1 Tax=Ornithobacterium rhinotracheale TaxID=28251 RepID=UPI0039A662BA
MKQLAILISIFFFISCQENNKKSIECDRIMQKMQYGEEEDIVTLKLTPMRYACGDCVPDYTVIKVVFSKNGNYDYYFNKEINLDIIDEILKQKIEGQINKMSNKKYDLIMKGKFRRNGFGMGKLEAYEGEIREVRVHKNQ